MNKRVGEIDEFTFEPLTEGNQLHVTIAISGWLVEDQGTCVILFYSRVQIGMELFLLSSLYIYILIFCIPT